MVTCYRRPRPPHRPRLRRRHRGLQHDQQIRRSRDRGRTRLGWRWNLAGQRQQSRPSMGSRGPPVHSARAPRPAYARLRPALATAPQQGSLRRRHRQRQPSPWSTRTRIATRWACMPRGCHAVRHPRLVEGTHGNGSGMLVSRAAQPLRHYLFPNGARRDDSLVDPQAKPMGLAAARARSVVALLALPLPLPSQPLASLASLPLPSAHRTARTKWPPRLRPTRPSGDSTDPYTCHLRLLERCRCRPSHSSPEPSHCRGTGGRQDCTHAPTRCDHATQSWPTASPSGRARSPTAHRPMEW